MNIGVVINYKGREADLGHLPDELLDKFIQKQDLVDDQVFSALLQERGRRDNLRQERERKPSFSPDNF